jgi:hypothetical protein
MDVRGRVAPVALGAVGPKGRSSTREQDQREQDEQRPNRDRRDAARCPSRGTDCGLGRRTLLRLFGWWAQLLRSRFLSLGQRCRWNMALSHRYHPFQQLVWAREGRP